MNIIASKTEFSDAEHAALAAKVKALVGASLSQAEIARQADNIPSSTLSQYLSGSYTSEPGRTEVATKLNKWLKARDAEAELRSQLPVAPSFLPLRTSKAITSALRYARELGRMVQVTGVPGVSKTATARQFAEDYPRTWYAAMNPATGGVPTMLLAILRAMGDTDSKGTPQLLMDRVCQRAREAKGLLIVDECQHLTPPSIETLRAVNDEVRIGIALLGNEAAAARVGHTGNKVEFAQVSSRIAMRRVFVAPDANDVADLVREWGRLNNEELTEREIAFCQKMASRPGGLRNIEMTMEAAILAARGDEEPLGLEHLQGAFAQLSGLAEIR
ncbi:MAG: AAA family ATPase [Pseudomonadota bacterium]